MHYLQAIEELQKRAMENESIVTTASYTTNIVFKSTKTENRFVDLKTIFDSEDDFLSLSEMRELLLLSLHEIERLREAVLELAGMARSGHEEDVVDHLNAIGYEQCLYCRESRDIGFADTFYPKEDMTPVDDQSLGCGFLCRSCAGMEE